MVVVLDDSSTECAVSCARVVVGAVGPFCGESPFEAVAHRFTQERPSDSVRRCDRVRIESGDAWRRPVVGGEDAESFVGEASRVGVRALVGSGCTVRRQRLARVRASGLVASLKDEAVAGVVIVVPSAQQPCGCSTSVKRYGGATRRRWRRFPGQHRPRRRSAAMRVIAMKSLIFWPRACGPEGCFFDHWRSDMASPLATGGTTRRTVRKHQAPKGALRPFLSVRFRIQQECKVRKYRAPKGALRQCVGVGAMFDLSVWSESTERQKVH